ncbi:universal stress protein [Frigoribacterium sp. UYMn621]|uniref:universal stress protein n=1 Tax=Frigoribacterium sp. UYMn621 TaxID=3156343 RepID=UPI0033969223
MTAAREASPTFGPLVVGVATGQSDVVVEQARALATRLGTQLICAWVDAGRYVIDELRDGNVRSMPIDPDMGDERHSGVPANLLAQLSRLLGPEHDSWSTRELAGDPARALGRLAEVVDASMIVVGTRRAGMTGSVQEMFNGSVAVHLAHRQHRPVVVIPLDPIPFERPLPWEDT